MLETIQFPSRLKADIAESVNFRLALKRLAEGKPATPRSWVYEDKSPQWILDSWSKQLKQLGEEKDLAEIAEWDLSKADKFAPQGGVAPFRDRLHTLEEYWNHLDPPQVSHPKLWDKAIQNVVKLLGFNHSGKPLSVDAVIDRGLAEDKYNTSSGDPLCVKRKKPEAIAHSKATVLQRRMYYYYPILGSRASMGKTGTEARWIFMFPMSVNLEEQRYQIPLQEYIRSKNIPFFAPWDGYDKVQQYLSTECPRYLLKFGCDYSKMDQHFNFWHGKQVFEVIKHFFQPQYWTELYTSIWYVFNCRVIGPEGLIMGPHAMPSGSGWTNFLETVFNFILVEYLKLVYHLKIRFAMGIGDDQLWLLDEKPSKKLTEFIVSQFNAFGLTANPEKQEVSTTVASFLQRRSYEFWSPKGIKYAGVYPTVRALTSEVFPEFYHNEKEWDAKMFALRCLMIMENCNNHPLFKEFCIFIAKGNKNIVAFAKMSDAEILLSRHQSKKIANFIPTYNQEKANVQPTKFESLAIIRDWAMKHT